MFFTKNTKFQFKAEADWALSREAARATCTTCTRASANETERVQAAEAKVWLC